MQSKTSDPQKSHQTIKNKCFFLLYIYISFSKSWSLAFIVVTLLLRHIISVHSVYFDPFRSNFDPFGPLQSIRSTSDMFLEEKIQPNATVHMKKLAFVGIVVFHTFPRKRHEKTVARLYSKIELKKPHEILRRRFPTQFIHAISPSYSRIK